MNDIRELKALCMNMMSSVGESTPLSDWEALDGQPRDPRWGAGGSRSCAGSGRPGLFSFALAHSALSGSLQWFCWMNYAPGEGGWAVCMALTGSDYCNPLRADTHPGHLGPS